MSTMPIGGSIDPYEIIEFVKQHAGEYSKMIRGEMASAQDRTQLLKDVSDLQLNLQEAGRIANWGNVQVLLRDFVKAHPPDSANGDPAMAEMDRVATAWQTQWDDDIKNGKNPVDGVDNDGRRNQIQDWNNALDSWKETIGGDDKIALMKLQQDASDLKDLYENGSNINAKLNESCSVIINNMGKG